MRLLVALLTLGSSSLGLAQNTTQDDAPNWRRVCEAAAKQPLSRVEPSGPLRAEELPACDETKLYFGIGGRPNYAAAVQCGWYQRAHPQHTRANMFYGPGILTMLYANGKGVSQDYDLAIRLACENEWTADAEMEYRIRHLQSLRAGGSQGVQFDLCDDITSGLSEGTCASIRSRIADAVREGRIVDALKKFSPVAIGVFPSLRSANAEFINARIAKEIDLSGTLRGAIQIEEESRLSDQFLDNLRQFGTNVVPNASAVELRRLDGELKLVYERIQQSPSAKWRFGTINVEGIIDTQRKWLVLVNAWMAFAQTAYPKRTATSIKAQLTRLRLQQLRSLAEN